MDTTTACRDIKLLKAQAQKACALFLATCLKRGVPIFLTETFRSQERQDHLYEQGRTRPGKIVTWTHNSRHKSGLAWDIACKAPHDLYDSKIIAQAGEIAAELGITWGGVWKSTPDTPHFEITEDWKEPATNVAADNDLFNAVSNITKRGTQLTFNAWKRLDLIKLTNVPALVCKLVGIKIDGSVSDAQYQEAIDKLVSKGSIDQRLIWDEKRYTVNNVRSLLIKYSKLA